MVKAMSKVLAKMTVTNRRDQILVKEGFIKPDQVRSISLNNVLADTGATTLCLPAELIQQLGLEPFKEVDVITAAGHQKYRLFQDARISLYGREGTFECLELPEGTDPLLGVIPLEALGLELSLQTGQITVLPMGSGKTYLTVL